MQTTHKCYRIDKDQIGFVKFIFEAHEGICVVSTLKSQAESTIVLTISPGCDEEVEVVINDLMQHIRIEPVAMDSPPTHSIY